jgi:hypothetical protein
MSVTDPIETIRDWYNRGQCGVFAAVLHERTGWPVCGLYQAPGRPGHEGAFHWVCRAPDGTYADAAGIGQAESDVTSRYAGHGRNIVIHETTLDDMVARFKRPRRNFVIARKEHLDLLLPDLDEALKFGSDTLDALSR